MFLFHAEVPEMDKTWETYEAVVQQEDIQAMKRVVKALQKEYPTSGESASRGKKDKKKKKRGKTRSRSRKRRRSATTESSHGRSARPEPLAEDGYEDLPGDYEPEDGQEDDETFAKELQQHFGQ